MKGLTLKYGIIGGTFSFFGFLLLQALFRSTDVQGAVVLGTIILSTVICCCTGILVETYQNVRIKEKS